MAGITTIQGPVVVIGSISVTGSFVLPAGSVGNAQANSSSPLDVTKTQHRFLPIYRQSSNNNVTNDRAVEFVGYSPTGGTIGLFQGGMMTVPSSNNYVVVNLIKNGTIISSININNSAINSSPSFTPIVGALNTNLIAQNDVLEVSVVCTNSNVNANIGQGVFAQLAINENP